MRLRPRNKVKQSWSFLRQKSRLLPGTHESGSSAIKSSHCSHLSYDDQKPGVRKSAIRNQKSETQAIRSLFISYLQQKTEQRVRGGWYLTNKPHYCTICTVLYSTLPLSQTLGCWYHISDITKGKAIIHTDLIILQDPSSHIYFPLLFASPTD